MKDTQFIISTAPFAPEIPDADPGSEEVDRRSFTVDIGGHGLRVDKVLAQSVAGFSRSYLQQLVEAGDVSVNQHTVLKSSSKLRIGDRVEIALRATEQSKAFVPEPMALDVVYEDEDVLIINKPAGLVVHPAPGNWTGTLLNGLLAYKPCFCDVPRAGIVHRLDKDTSGLMVVAKHRLVMDALVSAIARREVGRQYLAIAKGQWSFGAKPHAVEVPIGRDPANRLRMAVVDLARSPGKEARTDVTCLDQAGTALLVHCRLHTGRTHQIRVHMAHLRLPLVADAVYGGPKGDVIERQALHATRLTLVHPVSGAILNLFCPPPADFLAELLSLGLRYNENSLPNFG